MGKTYDFGAGPVPAHRHPNGGGWVADSASVADTAYVGKKARVFDTAKVFGLALIEDKARISGDALVYGKACICGGAHVRDSASVYGTAQVYGRAHIIGYACVREDAKILGRACIGDGVIIQGKAKIRGRAQIWGRSIVAGNAVISGKKAKNWLVLPVTDPRGYSAYASRVTVGPQTGYWLVHSERREMTIKCAREHWGEDYAGHRWIGDQYLAALDWLEGKQVKALLAHVTELEEKDQ